ncbi:hypothetical protein [Fructobacillus parabroussonetiae]|uniref:Uncharacterized protein n=1 Tax=Fructobacillus parabroussonetiae TaxID=2713174 RepID=A0ABS5QXT8_9LACO|nr:hypothetical protein [Fructobacillus parabroussonetiae]MBS9337931.1 hypothetical protein [Fructobacillus parabroussonetiae]
MAYTGLKILWAFLNLLIYPALFVWALHIDLSVMRTLIAVSAFFIVSNACFLWIIYQQYKKQEDVSENYEESRFS